MILRLINTNNCGKEPAENLKLYIWDKSNVNLVTKFFGAWRCTIILLKHCDVKMEVG